MADVKKSFIYTQTALKIPRNIHKLNISLGDKPLTEREYS